ncbi:tetratricopeptide repeat protein [Haloferula sargassicola]|uniref:Tetratricopeptide repeat protein n=1 Tax=Haloferula sargassicola TaxID=490096 RepID=A0ABP9UM89_9BACT
MKPRFLLAVLSLLLAPLHAQEPSTTKEDLAWVADFKNLPEEKRIEFAKELGKARELFAQKRIFETEEKLHDAQKIFADSPDVENLLGACKVEFRSFDDAMEHFKKADELSPDSPNVLFNIGEVYFVTKKWSEAEQTFRKVLEMIGDDEKQMQLQRLVEFKLMLSLIKLDKIDEAREMAEKYDEFDDSPYPYYAEAALAFNQGDELNAELALRRAQRIFRNPEMLNPWQDTLMEFGYLKSFIGAIPDAMEDPAPAPDPAGK